MNIETANRLYQYRKKSNFSQEELAHKIGVSRQAVSKWERAEASPDTDNLILLAKIYGVTLDALLMESPEDKPSTEASSPDDADAGNFAEDNGSDSAEESFDNSEKTRVSFKNGIHVHDDNDNVDISFRGIHVDTRDGTKVSIDKNGVFVDENGQTKVFTDENGHIIGNKEVMRESKKGKNIWMKLPVPFIIIIAFFVLGFLGWWHPAWMLFLFIPIYYTTVEAIIKRNANIFCYPILAVIIYLGLGFSPIHLWYTGWVIFLTIPIYYWVVSMFKHNK